MKSGLLVMKSTVLERRGLILFYKRINEIVVLIDLLLDVTRRHFGGQTMKSTVRTTKTWHTCNIITREFKLHTNQISAFAGASCNDPLLPSPGGALFGSVT